MPENPNPLIIGNHELAYVVSLVPQVSLSILAMYVSKNDPNVYFFMKMYKQSRNDEGRDVMCFTFFETTKNRAQRLLSSAITINNFERSALSVTQIEFTANEDGDSLEDVFRDVVPSHTDMKYRVLSNEEVMANGASIYALDNAGTFNALKTSLNF